MTKNELSKVISHYVSFTNPSSLSECVCKLNKEAIMVIFGIRRVVHLAFHAKKARTRKKNLHRAIKILEELK